MNRYVQANRELWDEWTDINYRSGFYDVEGFRAAPTPLDDIVRDGVGDLGGQSVLHLQCHFGLDTLRLARLAGAVTGVDFSPRAIRYARQLGRDLGSSARFVESDLYALPDALDGQFDVVFTSWGVINWLPDLRGWGRVIAHFLRPGGRFFLADNHPTLWLFDPDADDLRVSYPYFHEAEPTVVTPVAGNYADPTATVTCPEHLWSHSMADVVMALIGAGLHIDELREHAWLPWRGLSFLVEESPGRWVMPSGRIGIPLAFSLLASAP